MKSLTTLLYNTWLAASAGLVFSSVFFMFVYVGKEAFLFLRQAEIYSVFGSALWFPSEGLYGILALLSGTIYVVIGALCIAVPMGVLSAVALVFYIPLRLAKPLQGVIESFAGIPPVVVGLFGLLILIPWLSHYFPPGFGLMAASLVLGFLLIPSLTIHALEIISIDLIPLQQAANSLRISKTGLILHIVWPAKRKVLTCALSIYAARGLGETLAIMMVAGNVIQVPRGLFEPFRTINATIALEIPYALDVHRSALFFLGMLTFLMALGLRLVFRHHRPGNGSRFGVGG